MKLAPTLGLILIAAGFGFGVAWIVKGHPAGTAAEAGEAASDDAPEAPKWWTCPMHPEIQSPEMNTCSKCGMDLVPVRGGGDDPGPRRLRMSEAGKKLAEIVTAPVERRSADTEVRMVGMVEYDETRVRVISAWIPGRLDRLFVDHSGTRVRKGDHLVSLYSPDILTAQEELLEQKRLVAESKDERSEFLRQSNQRALESARDKLRLWGLSDSQIAAVEKRGRAQDHMVIPSPTTGVVIHKALDEGAYVKTGTHIYRIADLERLWVKLDAYESDLAWVRYGQDVSIEAEAYPGQVFRGWISFLAPELDRRTRTLKVRVNVANRDEKLKPGMFVRAVVHARIAAGGKVMEPRLAGKWICPMHPEIVADGKASCTVCGMALVKAEDLGYVAATEVENPLVVPATAVLWTGKRAVAYVSVPGEAEPVYEGRELVLGPRANDAYIVLAGLKENEQVVVNGSFKIDSALQILAKPSMMRMPSGPAAKARVPAVFRGALAPLYVQYFDAGAALAADDLPASRAALAKLGRLVADIRPAGLSPRTHSAWTRAAARLAKSVREAAAASDMDGVRAAFENVSRTVLGIEVEIGHDGTRPHYEVFCPMAFDNRGAAWMQPFETIRNPYFGASMLVCGEVRRAHPGSGTGTNAPLRKPAEVRKKVVPPKVAAAAGGLAARAALEPVYATYIEVQEALAADRFAGARQRFEALRDAITKVDMNAFTGQSRPTWIAKAKELESAVQEGTSAKDIALVRVAFKRASDVARALVEEFGHAGGAARYEVHCPMAFAGKGAHWLQATDQVRNPYYGASMLTCGSVTRRLDSAGH